MRVKGRGQGAEGGGGGGDDEGLGAESEAGWGVWGGGKIEVCDLRGEAGGPDLGG